VLLENGMDTRYIQAILGHASLESTQIYTRVSIRKLKALHTAAHPGRMPEAGSRAMDECSWLTLAELPDFAEALGREAKDRSKN
jgi:integrase/recombinase XerD